MSTTPQAPALVSRFGYNAAKLAAARATLSALQAAFKALEAWLAEYIKIARVALRADPQQFEKNRRRGPQRQDRRATRSRPETDYGNIVKKQDIPLLPGKSNTKEELKVFLRVFRDLRGESS